MRVALAEAGKAARYDEVPVGAVVVSPEGEIISRAYNRPIATCDPTAHAEIIALRKAARKIGNYRLSGCRLVATIEPCPMCTGAALHARVSEIIYGADDPKAGAVRTMYNLATDHRFNHQAVVTPGILAEQCAALLTEFFQRRRQKT